MMPTRSSPTFKIPVSMEMLEKLEAFLSPAGMSDYDATPSAGALKIARYEICHHSHEGLTNLNQCNICVAIAKCLDRFASAAVNHVLGEALNSWDWSHKP